MATTLRAIVNKLFGRHLALTNTLTSCGLFALGDIAEQKIEGAEKLDWRRTSRMFSMGLMIGPINHYWYTFLDKRWPGKSHRFVITKTLVDEIFMAPISASIFYIGMGILEKKKWKDNIAELKAKFLPTYIMDWKVWPAAQLVNFYLIPTRFRVLYVNCVTLCWNGFLSYMKHSHASKTSESA